MNSFAVPATKGVIETICTKKYFISEEQVSFSCRGIGNSRKTTIPGSSCFCLQRMLRDGHEVGCI
jgi:hypothetical protein